MSVDLLALMTSLRITNQLTSVSLLWGLDHQGAGKCIILHVSLVKAYKYSNPAFPKV